MPELPEVETTRRGIEKPLCAEVVQSVIIRHQQLRWPVPLEIEALLPGQSILAVRRRAKYLLLEMPAGTLMIHLGMSGCLRVVANDLEPAKHDHIDIVFENGLCLRYTDPRRFGSFHWLAGDIEQHPLIQHLGPEPLSRSFTGDYCYQRSRGRKLPIKQFIMDSKVVVGVGNIYANESLFQAGIHPAQPAGKISKARFEKLVIAIKAILRKAIKAGGTTLKDFRSSDGKPGYFKQQLQIYGREGEACIHCQSTIKQQRLGQRQTVFCPRCQRL